MARTLEELRNKHYEMDPDYIVDVLDLSAKDIVCAFHDKFIAYCYEEFDLEGNEGEGTDEGNGGEL